MKTREMIVREIFLQRLTRGMRTERCGFREVGGDLNYCECDSDCNFKGARRSYIPVDTNDSHSRRPVCLVPRKYLHK